MENFAVEYLDRTDLTFNEGLTAYLDSHEKLDAITLSELDGIMDMSAPEFISALVKANISHVLACTESLMVAFENGWLELAVRVAGPVVALDTLLRFFDY